MECQDDPKHSTDDDYDDSEDEDDYDDPGGPDDYDPDDGDDDADDPDNDGDDDDADDPEDDDDLDDPKAGASLSSNHTQSEAAPAPLSVVAAKVNNQATPQKKKRPMKGSSTSRKNRPKSKTTWSRKK